MKPLAKIYEEAADPADDLDAAIIASVERSRRRVIFWLRVGAIQTVFCAAGAAYAFSHSASAAGWVFVVATTLNGATLARSWWQFLQLEVRRIAAERAEAAQ